MKIGLARLARWRRRRTLPAPEAKPAGSSVEATGAKPTRPAANPAPSPAAVPDPSIARRPAVPDPAAAPASGLAALRGLGERPAVPAPDQAAEAELDTLRGELVRELDRIADDDGDPTRFRRAS